MAPGTRRMLIGLVFFAIALALPLYFVVIKKRAAASLEELIGERFKTIRSCPAAVIEVPQGGRVHCQIAYEDAEQPGVLLVVGMWDRGMIKAPQGIADVQQKVAGIFKPGTDDAYVTRMRSQDGVIVATAIDKGALVVWKGLPDRESVLAHLEATR